MESTPPENLVDTVIESAVRANIWIQVVYEEVQREITQENIYGHRLKSPYLSGEFSVTFPNLLRDLDAVTDWMIIECEAKT